VFALLLLRCAEWTYQPQESFPRQIVRAKSFLWTGRLRVSWAWGRPARGRLRWTPWSWDLAACEHLPRSGQESKLLLYSSLGGVVSTVGGPHQCLSPLSLMSTKCRTRVEIRGGASSLSVLHVFLQPRALTVCQWHSSKGGSLQLGYFYA
jgi:hypothetical protein